MNIFILILLVTITNLFAINIQPSTVDFETNIKSFTLYNAKSDPIGVYFNIKKIEKDKYGKITETELDEDLFMFNQPMIIIDEKSSEIIKVKYLKKMPETEEVYSLEIKEKILFKKEESINVTNNLKTKIFIGGKQKTKLTCEIKNNEIIFYNKNSKHIYLTNQNKIYANNKDITKELKNKKIIGYFLPKYSKNIRSVEINESQCLIK
jgi:P pilus assembly chaperone PapD